MAKRSISTAGAAIGRVDRQHEHRAVGYITHPAVADSSMHLGICFSSAADTQTRVPGGLGAYTSTEAPEATVWATADAGSRPRSGAWINTYRVGGAALSHLDAKPVPAGPSATSGAVFDASQLISGMRSAEKHRLCVQMLRLI